MYSDGKDPVDMGAGRLGGGLGEVGLGRTVGVGLGPVNSSSAEAAVQGPDAGRGDAMSWDLFHLLIH